MLIIKRRLRVRYYKRFIRHFGHESKLWYIYRCEYMENVWWWKHVPPVPTPLFSLSISPPPNHSYSISKQIPKPCVHVLDQVKAIPNKIHVFFFCRRKLSFVTNKITVSQVQLSCQPLSYFTIFILLLLAHHRIVSKIFLFLYLFFIIRVLFSIIRGYFVAVVVIDSSFFVLFLSSLNK